MIPAPRLIDRVPMKNNMPGSRTLMRQNAAHHLLMRLVTHIDVHGL
jgi:hypothetical protein